MRRTALAREVRQTLVASLILERISHQNCVLAFRARGQDCYRCTDEFLNMAHILDCLGWKIVPATSALGCIVPTFEAFIDRLKTRLCALACRQIINHLAIEPVAVADLDLFHAIQNIELGECDAANAVGDNRLANKHGIKPATTALAARDSAEFVATRAKKFTDL